MNCSLKGINPLLIYFSKYGLDPLQHLGIPLDRNTSRMKNKVAHDSRCYSLYSDACVRVCMYAKSVELSNYVLSFQIF
jgi:hypothetical protein